MSRVPPTKMSVRLGSRPSTSATVAMARCACTEVDSRFAGVPPLPPGRAAARVTTSPEDTARFSGLGIMAQYLTVTELMLQAEAPLTHTRNGVEGLPA